VVIDLISGVTGLTTEAGLHQAGFFRFWGNARGEE
jgi:hypothetical protein